MNIISINVKNNIDLLFIFCGYEYENEKSKKNVAISVPSRKSIFMNKISRFGLFVEIAINKHHIATIKVNNEKSLTGRRLLLIRKIEHAEKMRTNPVIIFKIEY